MKRLLLSLALATSLSVSAVAAEAPVTDHIPAFQTKIVENGEPIAGKPGQLRDLVRTVHPYDAGHARATEEVQPRSQEPHPHSVRVGR